VARICGHTGAQTSITPSQSPSRSFETGRPVGHASASALAKVSGIPIRSPVCLLLQDLVQSSLSPATRAGRNNPFPISAGSSWRDRDVARRVGHGRPVILGNKTTGIEPHPSQVSPTAERPWRLSQCPLPPSGWHALRAGAWHHCRRVVAPV
jgi:hypothetical protein